MKAIGGKQQKISHFSISDSVTLKQLLPIAATTSAEYGVQNNRFPFDNDITNLNGNGSVSNE